MRTHGHKVRARLARATTPDRRLRPHARGTPLMAMNLSKVTQVIPANNVSLACCSVMMPQGPLHLPLL